VELYEEILCDYIHKLGDERWMVYEQVYIASLDCVRHDLAKECIQALNYQFPGSLRVRRLTAMQLECLERYEDACHVYDRIILQDESDSVSRKRKVAILKAQGKIPEAIKELNDYLKKFMSDQEGWTELCDLYLLEQDYAKAAFCFEELLLYNPHNHLYHQKYAEIKYSQGGAENLDIARAYFAQALKLNSSNMRAAYGLFMAASSISALPKCQPPKRKENTKYAAWASAHIADKYKAKSSKEEDSNLKLVQSMIGSLQLGPASE